MSLLLLPKLSCAKFDEIDFQAEICKVVPVFKIKDPGKTGYSRYNFSLNTSKETPSYQYPIRIIRTIKGKNYTGTKDSYLFGKTGTQAVREDFYNECLSKGTDKLELILK